MAEPVKQAANKVAGALSGAFYKVAAFAGRSISPFHNLGSSLGQLPWGSMVGITVGLLAAGSGALPALTAAFNAGTAPIVTAYSQIAAAYAPVPI